MNKPCTYLLSALMASAVLAPVAALAADKSELEVRMEAAQKVLADRSYYERWSPEAALKTVEDAKAANEAGSARQKEIDGALDVMKDWCHTRFLVNACIKDARDLHHEREKEIRSVRLKADEMIRLDRVEQRAEEVKTKQSRAEERRALEEANVRAYEEKQARAARKAEERHDPIRVKSRVKAPSSPIEGHLGRTAADVEAGRAEAAERMAQEDANIAAFNAKQAEAKKRLEEAEATAAERKASREARQANFNKTLEERRAAQKRYEESRENKDSGLKKYF